MATIFSSALVYDVSTDARFRAIAQFVEDTFVATGGWSVTGDTGQTLPSALAHPTVGNQKQGYRIYRMTDPLQATFPVFIRVDFGSSPILTTPGIWLTIGTGTNGSGTITGIRFNGGASAQANIIGHASIGASPSTPTLSYGSAFHNRVAICLMSNTANAGFTLLFTLERTKDAVGDDTASGLLFIYKSGIATNTSVDVSIYITASGTLPLAENGLHYILSTRNPSQMFYPGDIGVGIVIHIAGIAQQPGTNMLVTNSGDVSVDGTIRLVLYNHIRTYVQCGIVSTKRPITFVGGSTAPDFNARVLMRFD